MSYTVLDLETQRLAADVGGWRHIEALQVSVACTWDEVHGLRTWWEGQSGDLLAELHAAQLIVGHGLTKFDYRVLSPYGQTDDLVERTFDMLARIREITGKLVGLETLATLNLGESKLYDGLEAVALWQAGDLAALEAKCRQDVDLTRRVFEGWHTQGVLWINPVDFVTWPGFESDRARRKRLYDAHHSG